MLSKIASCYAYGAVLLLSAVTSATPTPASASSVAVIQPGAPTATSSVIASLPSETLAPKVLFIANAFEFSYLEGYNFSKAYTGPMLDQTFNCTDNGETCMLAVGQELVSAMSIQALELIPKVNLSETYIIITGTGGVNPKHGTAGGVAISRFSVQWEWGSMFLGADLPANFSGQYFYAYAQDKPSDYPSLVGTEVYELNNGLVERFYNLAKFLPYHDVEVSLQSLRRRYEYAAAQSTPFLSRCDTVSAQVYWHGDVAGENVEYYVNLVTNGTALYCNTNEDDQGRLLALFTGALHKKVDFSRVAVVKAFSNFDRPPPGMSAYQSRYFVGEAATGPGLENAWMAIKAMANDVTANWDSVYSKGVKPTNYIGDACGKLGGTPDFGKGAGSC